MKNSDSNYSKIVDLGSWSEEALDRIIRESIRIRNAGSRVSFISKHFIGAPYKDSLLIGTEKTQEKLVINLRAFDCFTFIDSMEAIRLSRSLGEVPDNMIRIRYRDALVDYLKRNHFFTDWSIFNLRFVSDKTNVIGAGCTRSIRKRLNLKQDGSAFVKGLGPIQRTIKYIPSKRLDTTILKLLRSGDYIGITSDLPGLDVSHVGIVTRENRDLIFRHASSDSRHVVDQDFVSYINGKPGIIVLRPHG